MRLRVGGVAAFTVNDEELHGVNSLVAGIIVIKRKLFILRVILDVKARPSDVNYIVASVGSSLYDFPSIVLIVQGQATMSASRKLVPVVAEGIITVTVNRNVPN